MIVQGRKIGAIREKTELRDMCRGLGMSVTSGVRESENIMLSETGRMGFHERKLRLSIDVSGGL